MRTKRVLLLALSLLLTFGLLLSACAPAAETVVEEPEVMEEEQEPVDEPEPEEEPEAVDEPEPVEEPEEMDEPMAADDAVLDEAFANFLGSMVGYNVTNPQAVNEALVEGDVFLLDVRETVELEENGYIEGAVNIPLRELGKNLDLLPAADTPIVAYCGSGWRSGLAMTSLETLGWTEVQTMSGGFGAWKEAGYPFAEGQPPAGEALGGFTPDPALAASVDAQLSNLPDGWGVLTPEGLNEALIEEDGLIIIDVRKQPELDEVGYVEGSVHIQLEEMINNKDMWPADKDANIVVYCKAGTRGNIAATILRTYGYSNVRNLKGGLTAWIAAGLPVEGGYDFDANTQNFLDSMEGYNVTNPQAVNEALIENPPFLLDVREVAEVTDQGHIEGAINIPLRELGANLDLLPTADTPIVVYCGSGWRSGIAMTALELMGWTEVQTMSGGFGAWKEAGYPVVEGVPPAGEALGGFTPNNAIQTKVSAALANLPEGWGVLPAEALNEELVEGAELVIIDVRKPEELADVGFIEGAVHIQLEEMIANKDLWPAMDANIVVYCKAGTRGNIAATILRTYGYSNVRNLKGGLTAWIDGGFPVVME